jgi:hypothetical protein
MTAWSPVYRVKVNGSTVTGATLSGLSITSGRTDIYTQPLAGYCSLTLIETAEASVPFEINDAVTIEVQDSTAIYVNLFGGFITDLGITVQTSGSTATSQKIQITAVGALARLARAVYTALRNCLAESYLINGMKCQLPRLGMVMTQRLNGRMQKIAD